MVIVVISSLSEKKFKADNKNVYSSAQFCLGSISGKLQHVKSEELKKMFMTFQTIIKLLINQTY